MTTRIRNKLQVNDSLVSGNFPGFQSYASPVAEYSKINSDDDQLSAGVLAPNGKIYFIPGSNSGSTRIMVINPATGGYKRLDCGSWSGYGAVVGHDGFIYCFPYGSVSTIMRIDPETDDVVVSHKTGVGGSSDYLGATLHPNGNIYLIPAAAQNVGVYTPSTNNFSNTTSGLTGLPSGSAKWYGGCLAPNGKIYCAPYNHNSVLIIDVETPDTDITTIASMSTYNASSWRQGCLAPQNEKIYFSPRNGSSVLIVDPSDDSKDETTITVSANGDKWSQGIVAPNGKIICLPILATTALVINPEDDSDEQTTFTGFAAGDYKYYGRILGPNGKIYAPAFEVGLTEYLTLCPGGIAKLPMEFLLSPYVNNC